jgi:hypothetical protein
MIDDLELYSSTYLDTFHQRGATDKLFACIPHIKIVYVPDSGRIPNYFSLLLNTLTAHTTMQLNTHYLTTGVIIEYLMT